VLSQLAPKLEPAARRSIRSLIAGYRRGRVPWVCPLAVLRHYAELLGPEQPAAQSYLARDPRELALLAGG